MSISAFFAGLNAPLKNVRWSWGAVRPDGIVIFRAWKDDIEELDGVGPAILLASKESWTRRGKHPGWRERVRQIEQVTHGAPAAAIVCVKKDLDGSPRTIASFDTSHLLQIDRIERRGDEDWGVIGGSIPASAIGTLANRKA